MKRIAILIGICSLIAANGFGQKGFHVGAVGAFNTSWILSQNNFETLFDCPDELIQKSEMAYEITLGYHAGGILGYNFTDRNGIQIELFYADLGQNYEDQYSSTLCPEFANVRREVNLTYFQVPIVYRYSNGAPRSSLRWFFTVGPQLSFLLAASERVWISNVEKTNFQVSEDEKFHDFDFGLAFSGGLNYFINDEFFISAALSGYGSITDINGQSVKDFISNNDVKYRSSRNARVGVQFGVHYFFADYRTGRRKW